MKSRAVIQTNITIGWELLFLLEENKVYNKYLGNFGLKII
tara:strand:+ start:275 stop:394 length:120 start_codon:yes stop_codon:yes gene_type:complete